MNVRSSSLILACAVLLSASAPMLAEAQPQPAGDKKKALELFDKGKIQYDLGRWKQAVQLWMQAYETFNAPEFLFNIGQAYRHDGNCEQAVFFYRRYLSARPNAKQRGEVEGHIKDLETNCKPEGGENPSGGQTGAGTRPGGARPTDPGTGRASPGTGTPAGSGERAEGEGTEVAASDAGDEVAEDEAVEDEYEPGVEAEAGRPKLFATRVAVGPSFPSIGDLDVGTLFSLALGIGHPFYFGSFAIEPGALITYSPVPWEVEANMASGTAALTGLLANAGVEYALAPKLSLRADVGIGGLIFSGLTEDGNPFLTMDKVADGPLGFFHARGGLGAEYAITNNFVIHAQPLVFSYSPSSRLRSDIDSIRRFEMLVGAGYRM
jgi:tetratricopeptide (TPR) repeat protein